MLLSLILSSVLLGAVGQVLLKLGAGQLKSFSLSVSGLIPTVVKVVFTPYVFVGLVMFGLSFLLWVKVLTEAELSYAYPMVSLGYVVVTLLSWLLFKEAITLGRIGGLVLIVVGVVVVART